MGIPYPIAIIVDALVPAAFLAISSGFAIYTFLHLIFVERRPKCAFRYSEFKGEHFARLWAFVGPFSRASDETRVHQIMSQAKGVVIDLGPGNGQNIHHFDREKITKLWLVEPCAGLHPELRRIMKEARLDDISTIIPCGAEDTSTIISYGLHPSTADTISTVKVLCSVPALENTCQSLYYFLIPGGQWLVYEHVAAEIRYPFSRFLQNVYQLPWPWLLGGCNINRDTEKSLRGAGGWDSVELGRPGNENGWELLGHVEGRLIKAGD